MKKLYLLTALSVFSFYALFAQTVDDLFQQKSSLSLDYRSIASKYQSLQLNPQKLSSLRRQSSAALRLQLPFEGGQLNLQLQKVQITSDNFSVIEAGANGSRRTINYPGAVFYQGKIEGMPSSFATVSIVDGQVFGMIADNKSNIILGAIENNGRGTDEYVLYRESDLRVNNPMNCFTSETPVDGGVIAHPDHSASRVDFVGEPVDIYFECDNRFYLDKGSNTINLINYVLSFFNNTSLLYANENVKIQVSQILVWTTLDPEAASGLNSTGTVLPAFATRMATTTYIGDSAHFLSTRGAPCDRRRRVCYSRRAIRRRHRQIVLPLRVCAFPCSECKH